MLFELLKIVQDIMLQMVMKRIPGFPVPRQRTFLKMAENNLTFPMSPFLQPEFTILFIFALMNYEQLFSPSFEVEVSLAISLDAIAIPAHQKIFIDHRYHEFTSFLGP